MYSKLKSIISEVSKVPVTQISPATHLINDLGLDSLDIFMLILRLEERFDIDITDQDYSRLSTLSEIGRVISQKRLSVRSGKTS